MEFPVKVILICCLLVVTPRGYTSDGSSGVSAPFHPQCLAAFYGAIGEQPDESVRCVEKEYSAAVDVSLEEDKKVKVFAKVSGGGYLSYLIHEVQPFKPGEETYLLSSSLNTGGTGVFSQLMVVRKAITSNQLDLILAISGGDRCNDGYLSDIHMEGSSIYWSSAATPFRLLNPVNRRNERMHHRADQIHADGAAVDSGYFAGWRPYDDVENSAIGCAGSIQHRYDVQTDKGEVVGVQLNLAERWGGWPSQNQGAKHECLSRWRPNTPKGGEVEKVTYSMDEWQQQLKSIYDFCEQ